MGLIAFFKKIGSLLGKGLKSSVANGLTDTILQTALDWVRVASTKFTDSADKRNFVVAILMAKGIPESIARIAVELAVQVVKAEVGKIPQPKSVPDPSPDPPQTPA